MITTDDVTCAACKKLVIRTDGAAFRDGRVMHLPCYTRDGPIPPNQMLLGVHVLVVEDSPSTLVVLRAALEYSGAFVTTASDAARAKALLRDILPHVLVSTMTVPNDGFEVMCEVMAFAAESGRTIPVVAITASDDSRDRLRRAGFAAFIPKPFDPFVLAAVVAELAHTQR